MQERTLFPIKWYGASGFGRKFLDGIAVCVECDGESIALNRRTQTTLEVGLDEVKRIFRVGDHEIRGRFFIPDGWQAVVLALEGDLPILVKPEFDMRYYQEFNTDFSRYRAEETPEGLLVSNVVHDAGLLRTDMAFHGLIGTTEDIKIEMLPENDRLVHKTYLKDELRQKLIRSVYEETGESAPDHAPLWDRYSTNVYTPALFRGQGRLTLIYAFGDTEDEVRECVAEMRHHLPQYRIQKRHRIGAQLQQSLFQTGNQEIDTAYAHVVTRFNDALVARDACLHVDPIHREHYYGIFAGNKYFMDAWKRDENISLGALLETNDYETVRCILDNTWQFQDERTGRLPQIIRAGEPLVYYSSDGTLWALHRLFEYTHASGDETLLREKMPMIDRFFSASMDFVQRGLLPSGKIIDPDYLWETWADTPYTPRAGFPVEIQLLWLSVLHEFLPWVRGNNAQLADTMARVLDEGGTTFRAFECEGYLADSISYDWQPDRLLTPNGYLAFGLGYPLSPELQRSMIHLARDQLAGHRGIRSLAPRDWSAVFPTTFLEDPRSHRGKDMASVGIYNYHRGIEWEWLNPFFVAAELECGDPEAAYGRYVRGQVAEVLHEAGIGGLSELYDLHGELGADYQAWSMAGFVESLHRFAGVQVDALQRTIRICPALPSDWPHLRCRRRVGNIRFDVHYERPSRTSHEFQLRLQDPVPHDYTLHIGFRIPTNSRVRSATYNGIPMSVDSWSYTGGHDAQAHARLWTTQPLKVDTRIHLEL
ncbi:MAG: hypothetical protein NVS2B16_28540 [Chloroflexota bacterium]